MTYLSDVYQLKLVSCRSFFGRISDKIRCKAERKFNRFFESEAKKILRKTFFSFNGILCSPIFKRMCVREEIAEMSSKSEAKASEISAFPTEKLGKRRIIKRENNEY